MQLIHNLFTPPPNHRTLETTPKRPTQKRTQKHSKDSKGKETEQSTKKKLQKKEQSLKKKKKREGENKTQKDIGTDSVGKTHKRQIQGGRKGKLGKPTTETEKTNKDR